eukprot:3222109-Prymnesium_polylepis.1
MGGELPSAVQPLLHCSQRRSTEWEPGDLVLLERPEWRVPPSITPNQATPWTRSSVSVQLQGPNLTAV